MDLPEAADNDEMVFISQIYSSTQILPDQQVYGAGKGGHKKPQRRRRRSKDDGGDVGGRKRKLNEEQVNMLEKSFGSEHKLESERKDKLAAELGLDSRQVAVWFQNRRAKWKSKKLEEEYSKLKSQHHSAVVQTCCLENELLKLKERLHEAEKEIQRLSKRREEILINSPSSCFSIEPMDPPFLWEFGVEGLENVVFYFPDQDFVHGLEWGNRSDKENPPSLATLFD